MTRKRKLQIVLLIATLAFIWGHSCAPISASAAESGRVLVMLRPLLELFIGKENATDHLVRKLAHFAEFAVLGFQLLLLVHGSKWKKLARSVELGFIVAFLDESIQMLSGRGDQIIDVWLDVLGAAFGVLTAFLIDKLLQKRLERREQLRETA